MNYHTQRHFNLNEQLGEAPGIPHIHTICGNGYIIKVNKQYEKSPLDPDDFKHIVFVCTVVNHTGKPMPKENKTFINRQKAEGWHDGMIERLKRME